MLHGVQVDGGSAAGFRTGDLVHRSASGQWLFAGRADRQVKLDGRRIELGPIEEVISRRMRPLVQRTVVQLVGSPRRLHAFCQLEQPESLGAASGELAMAHVATVRQLCALELPRHLVPAGVTFLERLPVTPTGKLDQRALALLHERQCSLATSAELLAHAEAPARDGAWTPNDGWLHTVACCWAAELGLPLSRLSARSNFQRLSGNSLVALRIGSRLWQQHASCRAELGGDRFRHSELGGDRFRHSELGGTFGERMGVFAPITLLTTPVLEEYAQATAPAASEAAFDEALSMEEVDSKQRTTVRPTQLGSCSADPNSAGRPSSDSSEIVKLAGRAVSSDSEIEELAGQAVSLDAVALLRLLLLQQDYSHTVDNDLLIAAARSSSNACAELLLQHGASPNAIGFGALTALHFALQRRNTALAQLLLGSRADVRATDENLQTVLHHAARAGGDALCFEMLLRSYAASTSEPGTAENAKTPEAVSVAEVQAQAPETGIDHEACGRLDKWGRLPLHWAIVNGHRDAMVALVEAGSNVWLRDFQNQSSMDLAEERAMCREWLNGSGNDGGRCDQLTLSMLKLMAGGADAPPVTAV